MNPDDDIRSVTVLDGSVVEYSVGGDGPAIVLIHAGGFADWFIPTAAILRQRGFRTVRVRRAGYGTSTPAAGLTLADHATHTAAVLEQIGIASAHVVGHSSGALVALDLAAARPDLVARLTLFEPAPGGRFAPSGPDESSAPPPPPTALGDAFDAFMTVACGPDYLPVLTDALGAAGLDRARVESAYFLADEIPAVLGWPFDPATAVRIIQPTTLAWGTASWPVYHDVCAQLQRLLPNTNPVTVDGGDHLLPLRQPIAFAALITQDTASSTVDQGDSR